MDLNFPREPKRGEPLDAAWGVAVVRCLRALALMPGLGYLIRRNLEGTKLEITARGGGGAPSFPYPFRVSYEVDPEDEESWLVTVNDGFVNGVPVTIDGVELYADPRPTLSVPRDALSRIYVEIVTASNFDIDTAELKTTAGAIPANVIDYEEPTNTRLYFLVATITAGGAISPNLGNNLSYIMTSSGPSWSGV